VSGLFFFRFFFSFFHIKKSFFLTKSTKVGQFSPKRAQTTTGTHPRTAPFSSAHFRPSAAIAATAVSGESALLAPGAFLTGAKSEARETSWTVKFAARGKASKINVSSLMPLLGIYV
jgi:hypothetical protein